MTGWLFLAGAAAAEVVFAVLLPATRSFTRLGPSLAVAASAAASLALLSRAMLHIPGATAYAIWVGAGTAGAVLVPYALGGPRPSAVQMGAIAAIVIAVVALRAKAA